jgi:predicted Zn-dependent peptidase
MNINKKINLHEYKNGLKCIFQKDSFNNICVINIFYPVDMSVEKNEKGIGYFSNRMLFKGTLELDAHQFSLELEKEAIFLDVSRSKNYINFSLVFDKKFFNKAINFFEDIIKIPKFDDKEIKKLKKEFLNALYSRHDDIRTTCSDEFLNLIYGKNNYKSWSVLGTHKSINDLNKNKLKNFHEKYILNNLPIISIIGNLEYKDIENNFLKIFDNNKKINIPDNNTKPINKKNLQKQIKKDFNQAYIMHGIPMASIQDNFFINLKLINNYLGGGMTSILFEKIREQMGLAYEIGSSFSSYNSENYWMIHLGLDKKNVNLALDSINKEITKFLQFKINEKDLNILKNKIKKHEILKYQKKASRCFYLGLYELLGLGYNYSNKYLHKLDTINIKNMNQAIQHLFAEKKFVTSIII